MEYYNLWITALDARPNDWNELEVLDQALRDMTGLRSTTPRPAPRFNLKPSRACLIVESDVVLGEDRPLVEHIAWAEGILTRHLVGLQKVVAMPDGVVNVHLRVMTTDGGSELVLPPSLIAIVTKIGATISVKFEHYPEGLDRSAA